MPRTARIKNQTGIYHMILRGINKQTIFEDSQDAEKFLQTLEEYKVKSEYKIYAYCLMGNHIHMLIKPYLQQIHPQHFSMPSPDGRVFISLPIYWRCSLLIRIKLLLSALSVPEW